MENAKPSNVEQFFNYLLVASLSSLGTMLIVSGDWYPAFCDWVALWF